MKIEREKLMIPGPVEVSNETLAAMGSPVVAHYGEKWVEFYDETLNLARKVFQSENYDVFLIPGSGSAGLEAALGSVVGGGRKLLVLINGFFGRKIYDIANAYSDDISVIDFDLGNPIDPNKVEDFLVKHPEIEVAAATHCETSTGVENPIKEISSVCTQHDVLFIVDAVSSLGGSQLKTEEWGIDICVSASQKGLESPPGIALVSISPKAWDKIENTPNPGWYLNLKTWRKAAQDMANWHPYPVTMPVNNILALKKSLNRILDEGLEARFLRHKEVADFLRKSLRKIGLSLFAKEGFRSNMVTLVKGDARFKVDNLRDYLEREYSIKIAGTLGELKGEELFRIGHMGLGGSYASVLPLLFGVEEYLRKADKNINLGQFLYDELD